jgi:hypothetical protein
VEIGEIILLRALHGRWIDVAAPFVAGHRAAFVGIRRDETGIDGKAMAADEASLDSA